MPLHRYSTALPAVVDVTLRDGGYANDHQFSLDEACALIGGLAEAGLPNIEVGYFSPEDSGDVRPTACCPPEYLRTLRSLRGRARLLVMAHAAAVPLHAYAPLAAGGIDAVRLPCSPASLNGLRPHLEAIHAAGMRASVNLIRISELHPQIILNCARMAEEMGADWLYLADSNGMLVPEDVFEIVKLVSGGISIPVGLHLHNGLGLAFINALYGLQAGARMIDGSVGGLGKGGGNLPLEVFAAYLNGLGASFDIARIVDTAETGLSRWLQGVRESATNAISSLLNLNLDAIAALRQESIREQVPFLDLVSRRLRPAVEVPSLA
jgi:4-hydroxy 2-oxovalerate aldolase